MKGSKQYAVSSAFQGCLRPIALAALVAGGFLYVAAPVRSQTAAGTTINNTANATYTDPNNPGTTINATSNTVTVTVVEIAGITATPAALTDANGGTVLPNDILNYDFRITNVGNDPTRFFLPGTASLGISPATQGTAQVIGFQNAAGVFTAFAPVNIPAGGTTTDVLAFTIPGNTPGSVPAGFSLVVRVPVTVNALAPAGAAIRVQYGDVPPNDNSAATQNQPAPGAPTPIQLLTLDNPNGAIGESAGVLPAASERQASVFQQILVGSQPQAFAAILKTSGAYVPNTAALTDDLLTYNLSVRVDPTAPAGSVGLTPAPLAGTPINLGGVPNTIRILVSDAIPAGTVLNAAPVAPAGWTVVYTTSPTATVANAAAWSITPPGAFPAPTITRVGFINDGPIAPSATPITGFSFQVVTTNATGTSFTIANIAQVFGETDGVPPGPNTLIYDESGDTNPTNVNDNGTPGSNVPNTGVANPPVDGVDNNNTNTGTGPGGEDNVFTIATPGTILNGPNGQPAAVGPTNNNDDFTNQSTPIPAGTAPGSTIDPAPVTFTNTVNNPAPPGGTTLTNVLLVPDDGAATGTLPIGTLVTVTLGGTSVVYTYNGTDFIFTSGGAPLLIPSLAPSTSVNYTVTVDLPSGTPLSTDTGNGFPVPIFAFVDTNGNGRPDAADTTQNATIDRLYTGFLRLVKEAQILGTDGITVLVPFTQTSALLGPQFAPGRFLEYRITYTNISSPPAGSGNVILNANAVVITENGVTAPNNWALDNPPTPDGIIDTSNVVGRATATSGTITYSPAGDQTGTTAATDVTQYVNTPAGTVAPQANGTFIFRRRFN